MYDLVSIGDIVIDLFFQGESLTFKDDRFQLAIGGKYFVDTFYESLGGGGSNVAVGTAHFGLNTAVCGKVGENVFKQIIIQKLIQKHVSTEFILHENTHLNLSSIYLNQQGERSIVNYQTPDQQFEIKEAMLKNIVETKMVYMGNLPGVSVEQKVNMLNLFQDHKAKIILNFGVTDCRLEKNEIKKMTDFADILIVNRYEYADIIKKEADKIDLKNDCGSEIGMEKKIVIVTDSKDGSYLYNNGKVLYQPALNIGKEIDTTGAGDAYTSGFVSAYFKEEALEACMLQGAQYANKIIGQIGAQ